jgi:competence ComEA-like helix-hairpin-helix protein
MNMNRFYRLALTLVIAFSAFAAQAQLPDGAGKETMIAICGNCHGVDVITGYHLDKQGWTDMISKMIDQGAQGSEQQFNSILAYLIKNFGTGPVAASINVNKADAKDLEKQLEITTKEAAAIVKYRGEKGSFKALTDLKSVPDLDYKKIEAKKDRIVFE